MIKTKNFLFIIIFILISNVLFGEEYESYKQFYDDFTNLQIDKSTTKYIRDFFLQKDIATFTIDSAEVYFTNKLGSSLHCLVIVGDGTFSFNPPLLFGKNKLMQNYQKDKFNDEISSIVILYNDQTDTLFKFAESNTKNKKLSESQEYLEKFLLYHHNKVTKTVTNETCNNFLNKSNNGYFCAQINFKKGDPVIFEYDPENELEVGIYKLIIRPSLGDPHRSSIFNLQSEEDINKSFEFIESENKELITIIHCEINSKIEENMDFRGNSILTFKVLRNFNWIKFNLDGDLSVDSILINGKLMNFFHHDKTKVLWIKAEGLKINKEENKIVIYYNGKIIYFYGNTLAVKHDIDWFPYYTTKFRNTTWNLHFQYPNYFNIVASGIKKREDTLQKVIISSWEVNNPCSDVYFSINKYKTTVFKNDTVTLNLYGQFTDKSTEFCNKFSEIFKYFSTRLGLPNQKEFNLCYFTTTYSGQMPNLIDCDYHYIYEGINSFDFSTEYYHFLSFLINQIWWYKDLNFKNNDDCWLRNSLANYFSFLSINNLNLVSKKNQYLLDKLELVKKKLISKSANRLTITKNDSYIALENKNSNDNQRLRDSRFKPVIDKIEFIHKKLNSNGKKGFIEKDIDNTVSELDIQPNSDNQNFNFIYLNNERGLWIIHMLRSLLIDFKTMKDEDFYQISKDFYQTNKGKDVSVQTFVNSIKKITNLNLNWFFDEWVNTNYIPTYTYAYKIEPTSDGKFKVKMKVKQTNVPDNFQMVIPIQIGFGNNRFGIERIIVDKKIKEIELPIMSLKPEKIDFNIFESVLCEVKEDDWDDIK